MRFTVYTKNDCVWCEAAKAAIISYGDSYDERKVGYTCTKKDLIEVLPKDVDIDNLTVPQIFTERGDYVGGYLELSKYYSGNIPNETNNRR